jgi:excisionase family DNA binding protein
VSADEFMTVAEVASILKLNQQTVRNWIDAGTLPAVRIGRRARLLLSVGLIGQHDWFGDTSITPAAGASLCLFHVLNRRFAGGRTTAWPG